MEDLDVRRERAARNQSLFREVNERIAALSKRFSEVLEPSGYLCECLDTSCAETIQLTQREYELMRAHANRFFVLPGHADPAVEVVVEEGPGYVVVAKVGVGSELAASMDPRASTS